MKILGSNFFKTKGHTKTVPNAVASKKESEGSGNFKGIVNQIVAQFKDQSRKDIQKWRKALALAGHPEKPRLTAYHDLLDDLLTDGHLFSQVQLRKYATFNTEFNVQADSGKINEEGTKLFDQQWFYDFLNEAIEAILRGPKLVEFDTFDGHRINFNAIPQRNVVPVLKLVFPDLTKEDFINYDDPAYENWLIQIGKDKDMGVLNNVIPNLIWMRNVYQAWAEFCERFGLPMVVAYTNKSDTDTIDRIDYMLSQIAMASRGVFPEGARVEFKEANRTDAYNVFDKFIERNKKVISQALIGGTMLTDDGSSRSQSEVHERNLDEKIAVADKRAIEFLVNDQLIPLLQNQGYSFLKEGDRFTFNQSHNLELDKFWTITSGVMQDFEVDPEWLSKTFSIPIVGKKKSIAPKVALENEIQAVSLPDYPSDDCCGNHGIIAATGKFEKQMEVYHNDLLLQLWDNQSTLPSEAKIIALESLQFIKGLFKGWGDRRLEVGYDAPDHLMLQLMEFNLFEFTTGKTEARLAAMSELLIDKEKMGIRSFSDFKKEAEKVSKDFNRTWLETEYNLSVAVGQNSANYARFMSEKDTVTAFVRYETAGDKKVRSEHQLLDGRIFNLNDPDARDLWPPNGYNCRCEMVQHIGNRNTVASKGSTAKKLLGEKFIGSQFDINRGDLKKVFTKKQFYSDIKGLDKKINTMEFDKTYGMESWTVFKKRLNAIKLDQTITGDNVKELFRKDGKQGKNDFMGFTDYLKRKIIIKKTVFKKHTEGKYLNKSEERHRLFPHVEGVLSEPDEVWMYSHDTKRDSFQVRYIKFYKDQVLIIDTALGRNNMEVLTWYSLKTKEKDIRRGLLIKKRKA